MGIGTLYDAKARKGFFNSLLTMLCLKVFIHYHFVRTALLKPSSFVGLSDTSYKCKEGNGANKCNLQVKFAEAIKKKKVSIFLGLYHFIEVITSPLKVLRNYTYKSRFLFCMSILRKAYSTEIIPKCHAWYHKHHYHFKI